MPVRMPVSDRHSDRPPDRPFSLGPPSPGARPRGLGDHPPALPSPLRGRSLRRARASSPPTLPSHHRGGAGVRRLLYAFPPSHPFCAGLSQDMASRRARPKKNTTKNHPPSSPPFAGDPHAALARTVNNYFVAGCSGYFFRPQWRGSRAPSPPLRARVLAQAPALAFGTLHSLFSFVGAGKSAEPRGPS